MLVSIETMVSDLSWFIVFRFLTGNPYSNIKNLLPVLKVNKSNFR